MPVAPPFEGAGTFNGFDYGAGNPVLFADPTGHLPWWGWLASMAAEIAAGALTGGIGVGIIWGAGLTGAALTAVTVGASVVAGIDGAATSGLVSNVIEPGSVSNSALIGSMVIGGLLGALTAGGVAEIASRRAASAVTSVGGGAAEEGADGGVFSSAAEAPEDNVGSFHSINSGPEATPLEGRADAPDRWNLRVDNNDKYQAFRTKFMDADTFRRNLDTKMNQTLKLKMLKKGELSRFDRLRGQPEEYIEDLVGSAVKWNIGNVRDTIPLERYNQYFDFLSESDPEFFN